MDLITEQLPERGRFYRGLAGWVGFEQRRVSVRCRRTGCGLAGKWSRFALIDLAVTAITSFTSAPLRLITILGMVTLR